MFSNQEKEFLIIILNNQIKKYQEGISDTNIATNVLIYRQTLNMLESIKSKLDKF